MKTLFATAALLLTVNSANAGSLICDAPQVIVGDRYDSNPVVGVEVDYISDAHEWRVYHHMANGQVVSRAQQYAMTDWSNASQSRWAGSLNRNRNLFMVAQAGANPDTGESYYEEKLYDRSQGNRLDMHMRAHCQVNLGRFTLSVEPQRAPPSPPVVRPSFDCRAATTDDEMAVCYNPLLAAMDVKMARLYYGIKNALPPEKQKVLARSQTSWLSVRRDCSHNYVCIGHAYQLRVNQLYDVIRSAPMCGGPIMRQPIWCDAGGSSTIYDEEIAALQTDE